MLGPQILDSWELDFPLGITVSFCEDEQSQARQIRANNSFKSVKTSGAGDLMFKKGALTTNDNDGGASSPSILCTGKFGVGKKGRDMIMNNTWLSSLVSEGGKAVVASRW